MSVPCLGYRHAKVFIPALQSTQNTMWRTRSSRNDHFSYIRYVLLNKIDRLAIVKMPLTTRKSATVQKSFKVPRGSMPRLCCSFCTKPSQPFLQFVTTKPCSIDGSPTRTGCVKFERSIQPSSSVIFSGAFIFTC
jgi:hypothetical protein